MTKTSWVADRLRENCNIFYFGYKGKDGNVDQYYFPQTKKKEYLLYFDGNETTVHSFDEVMNTPFIDGKTLNEVQDEIEEW